MQSQGEALSRIRKKLPVIFNSSIVTHISFFHRIGLQANLSPTHWMLFVGGCRWQRWTAKASIFPWGTTSSFSPTRQSDLDALRRPYSSPEKLTIVLIIFCLQLVLTVACNCIICALIVDKVWKRCQSLWEQLNGANVGPGLLNGSDSKIWISVTAMSRLPSNVLHNHFFLTPHYSNFVFPFVQGNCQAFDRDRRTKGSQQGIHFKYYQGTCSHEPELHDIRSSAYLLQWALWHHCRTTCGRRLVVGWHLQLRKGTRFQSSLTLPWTAWHGMARLRQECLWSRHLVSVRGDQGKRIKLSLELPACPPASLLKDDWCHVWICKTLKSWHVKTRLNGAERAGGW